MEQINFKDLDALRAKVDEQFGAWSQEVAVTQQMINDFADVTGDHQWIHVDPVRAKAESPFGGTIAHGFFVMSLLPAFTTPKTFEVVGNSAAVNYGGGEYRFVSPVPSGSMVHARMRLALVEENKKGTLLTSNYEIAVVGSAKPSLAGSVKVLYI